MRVHFIGIEGVSMRVLAEIERRRGNVVTGSDITTGGHNADNVVGADLVVYTSAVGEYNVELIAARKLKIPVVERALLLGEIAATYDNVIAVAGSHGKTTVTGMIGGIFSPLNPTVHIGGKVKSQCGYIGDNKYFITESCEYHRSFLHIKPSVAIVLNIDLDHTDYYRDLDDVKSAFREFVKPAKHVIVNGDDSNCLAICKHKITVGLCESNDYRATCLESNSRGCYSFCLKRYGVRMGRFKLSVPGKHNVYNALAALACADYYKLNLNYAADKLRDFLGAERRFERLGIMGGTEVISDYAHHPKEIEYSIATAREAGYNKVAVVFQPHTYSRTKSLLDDFAASLKTADEIIVAPIFAAREAPFEGVSSHDLVRRLIEGGAKAIHMDTFIEIVRHCKDSDADVIIFMGAGDIDKAGKMFINSNR